MAVTLDSLKKSIGKKNSNSRAFAWLADLEREAGDLDEALQRVDGGLTFYSNDVAAHIVRSKILFQQENYEPCIQECNRILVMEPFNLAAQRIMGDAYDKLGNEAERNRCYRRLHDMDPLNDFWKEEYDVIVEAPVAATASAVAEMDFSMPDEGSLQIAEDAPAEQPASAEETVSGEGEFKIDESPMDLETGIEKEPAEVEDPFAALAAMIPNSDAAEDSTMEDLSASLDSVMESIETDSAPSDTVEEFPADEDISVGDVGSALSDMFGVDDDLEPEEIASSAEIPSSIDDNPQTATGIFATEDEPTTVDDAFASIFGEDELPEEKPAEASAPLAMEPAAEAAAEPAFEKTDSIDTSEEESLDDSFGLFEKSADQDFKLDSPEDAPEAELVAEPAAEDSDDKPTTVDDAFASIFGEDELPEEKPAEASAALATEPAAEAAAEPAFEKIDSIDTSKEEALDDSFGLFEKSADQDFKLDSSEDAPEAELVAEPAAENSDDKPTTVDDAFASIFGEDELPEEKPAEASAALATEPAAEPATEAEVEPAAEPLLVSDESVAVDQAFSSIFGDDDDLPEEPKIESAADFVEDQSDESAGQTESTSLAEQVDQAESELEMPETKDDHTDLAKEMGGVFASMFGGDDDDLDFPLKSETAANDQEATGAAIEENFDKNANDSLSSDLDKSFDSLFGNDDDLESSPAAAPENAVAPDLDSLETEVSGAFKGLFDMDDDSLADEEKPSNKGVDFLMSGDSDDEISAGLINDPDAPLDRGAHDLDESLNTRTLAEIYFDQGLYGKALEIYKDLVQKEPENKEIADRFAEVEQLYKNKFGENA